MRNSRSKAANPDDVRRRLGSANSYMRYQAYLDALDLPAADLLRLAAVQARRTRATQRVQYIGIVGGVVWILSLIMLFVAALEDKFTRIIFHFVAVLWPCVCCLAMAADKGQEHFRSSLVRLLQQQTDARFVAPVLMLYDSNTESQTRADLRQILLCLLPKLTSADVREWTLTHKTIFLNWVCSTWNDLELLFCILDTLARVGDAEAVSAVRRLAKMGSGMIEARLTGTKLCSDLRLVQEQELETERRLEQRIRSGASGSIEKPVARTPAPLTEDERRQYEATALYIKQKAEETLSSILERAEQRQHAEILLRSSAVSAAGETELLRPAAETNAQTPDEQLLRPQQ